MYIYTVHTSVTGEESRLIILVLEVLIYEWTDLRGIYSYQTMQCVEVVLIVQAMNSTCEIVLENT